MMVNQIGDIEKSMMNFKTSQSDIQSIENFVKISLCQDYLTLLDQQVLKNIMIRLRSYIDDDKEGIRWLISKGYHQANYFGSSVNPYQNLQDEFKALNENKPFTGRPVIRQAICEVVKKYFNSFLSNQISTSNFFNMLFEYNVIQIYLLQEPKGLNLPNYTKFDVIDFIVNVRFNKILNLEFANKKTQDLLKNFKEHLTSFVSSSQVKYYDPYLSVDVLVTSWLDRRISEFQQFMKNQNSFTQYGDELKL